MEVPTLDPGGAAGYLVERGLAVAADEIVARSLGGGVSNVVLDVDTGSRRLVVKQSLPRLRVEDEWLAKRERVVTEADALRAYRELTPESVPRVLDVAPDRFTIVIEHAPPGWLDWKSLLLEGDADPGIAAALGRVLGTWHGGTWDREEFRSCFADLEAFEQLRVDPYYRTLMRRRPDLAGPVAARIESMATQRRCLCHGDFSPKNVLCGGNGLWVLDAEVAHFGDPGFDTGFMLNHLFLKAVHRPAALPGYAACARAFWSAYAGPGPRVGEAETLGHLACLMLSRVHGKSPAEYLDEDQRGVADGLGVDLLLRPPASLAEALERLEAAL
jgi:5-methylthioribose kinase